MTQGAVITIHSWLVSTNYYVSKILFSNVMALRVPSIQRKWQTWHKQTTRGAITTKVVCQSFKTLQSS